MQIIFSWYCFEKQWKFFPSRSCIAGWTVGKYSAYVHQTKLFPAPKLLCGFLQLLPFLVVKCWNVSLELEWRRWVGSLCWCVQHSFVTVARVHPASQAARLFDGVSLLTDSRVVWGHALALVPSVDSLLLCVGGCVVGFMYEWNCTHWCASVLSGDNFHLHWFFWVLARSAI